MRIPYGNNSKKRQGKGKVTIGQTIKPKKPGWTGGLRYNIAYVVVFHKTVTVCKSKMTTFCSFNTNVEKTTHRK